MNLSSIPLIYMPYIMDVRLLGQCDIRKTGILQITIVDISYMAYIDRARRIDTFSAAK